MKDVIFLFFDVLAAVAKCCTFHVVGDVPAQPLPLAPQGSLSGRTGPNLLPLMGLVAWLGEEPIAPL